MSAPRDDAFEVRPATVDPTVRSRNRLLDLCLPLPLSLATAGCVGALFEADVVEWFALAFGYAFPGVVGCVIAQRAADMRAPHTIPLQVHRTILIASLGAVLLAPALVSLVGSGGWLSPIVLRSVVLYAVLNAVAVSQVTFYRARRRLRNVRRAPLAGHAPSQEADRPRMVSRLKVAIAGTSRSAMPGRGRSLSPRLRVGRSRRRKARSPSAPKPRFPRRRFVPARSSSFPLLPTSSWRRR